MTTPVLGNEISMMSGREYQLHRMVVAHDGSSAAEHALEDAAALASRFAAEIVLVRVELPDQDMPGAEIEREFTQDHADLKIVSDRLINRGLKSRAVLRTGLVGDVLFRVVNDENADLLLLGAYGQGTKDRATLGSTAEFLLRAIPCPVLTYGPNAASGLLEHMKGPSGILLPINLPCDQHSLVPAIAIAKLFGKSLELLHVCPAPGLADEEPWAQNSCDELACGIRQAGIPASSFLMGTPETSICSCASARSSPVILFPLTSRNRLSSITSDNVAAKVIRRASVPVMSYRLA